MLNKGAEKIAPLFNPPPVLSLEIICIANIIDTMIISNDSTIRTTVISFYLSKEGFAILDNLEHLGVPLPPIIVKIIKQLNSEENNEENNEEDGEEGIEENSD